MRTVNAKCGSVLPIGRLGENEATVVVFDIASWKTLFGQGTFSLLNQRNGDAAPYSCVIEQDETQARWKVQSADVAKVGYGQCELIYTVGDTIAKSEIYTTVVGKALTGGGDVPEPWEDWVQRVLEAGQKAEDAVEHYPYISNENYHWYVWDVENEEWTDTGIDARGVGVSTWHDVSGKPFETLGETLQVDEDGVLNIVIPPEYGRITYDGTSITVS